MNTCKTPKEDLMNDALKHYEEASAAVHHWNSEIPKAIKQYYSEKTASNQMNWTKRRTQQYGIFMAILGFVVGGCLMFLTMLLL